MNEQFIEFDLKNYQYTEEFDQTDSPYKINDPKVQREMAKVYSAVVNHNSGFFNRAERFNKKYPELPQAKNFLIKACEKKGHFVRAKQLNDELLKSHPDYLYAKTNAALFHFYNHEPEKMIHHLGVKLDLSALYPDRKVFHDSEIKSFIFACTCYFIGTDQLPMARKLVSIMEEIDPNHYLFQEAEELINRKYWEAHAQRQEKIRLRKEAIGSNKIPEQKSSSPDLENQELKILYKEDLFIPFDYLNKILSLPRKSLINDLQAILMDSMHRFWYFQHETEYSKYTHSFPMHSLFLLSELKAEEALDTILLFFSMPEELLKYWLGDIMLEKSWQVIYNTANQQLDKLKDFIMNQKNYTYASSEVSCAIEQIVYHQPERRNEIVIWYNRVFETLLSEHQKGAIIDTEALTIMVWANMNFQAKEQLGTLEKLYAEDLIEKEMVGDFAQLQEWMASEKKLNYKRDLENIFELYNDLNGMGDLYNEEEDEEFDLDVGDFANLFEDGNDQHSYLSTSSCQDPVNVKKTGRNDPCPCGSGKKYKKCCMNT